MKKTNYFRGHKSFSATNLFSIDFEPTIRLSFSLKVTGNKRILLKIFLKGWEWMNLNWMVKQLMLRIIEGFLY